MRSALPGHDVGTGVVVHTPLLPASLLLAWAAAPDPRAFLAALLREPAIEAAVHVADPGLVAALDDWRRDPGSPGGPRTERELARCIARLIGGGAVAGFSVGAIGPRTELALAPRAAHGWRAAIPLDALRAFVAGLVRAPAVRERLTYRRNRCAYALAGRHHVPARLPDGGYRLVSIRSTPQLDATLARAAGARIDELAVALCTPEVPLAAARAFIGQLVDAELLVPELGVQVTGGEPLAGLVAQLRGFGLDEPAAEVDRARAALAALDPSSPGAAGRALEAAGRLGAARIHVDVVKPGTVVLDERVAQDIAGAVALVSRISVGGEQLDGWRAAFRERWSDREVALAEALDDEAGIGWPLADRPRAAGAPLLDGLRFPVAGSRRVAWRNFEDRMLRLLAAALAAGDDEIALTADDLDAMQLYRPARLPDAFAARVRLGGSGDAIEILFEGTSGPSAARRLGRLCHASPAIDALVRAHCAAEQALAPDRVFAEIVHAGDRAGDGTAGRPALRAHEIVLTAQPGVPADRRIELDDLVVSVRDDRIALRSRRLGREIVPRLATDHDYRSSSLAVYRFLCAVAHQDVQHAGFTWSVLSAAPRLPRVRSGRIVLARAQWNLQASDVIGVPVAELRRTWKLPRFVAIATGQDELPIDLENPVLASVLADEVTARQRVALLEMFPAPGDSLVRGPEGSYGNAIELVFTRVPGGVARDPPRPAAAAAPLRRSFAPGTEWFDAKIYCGETRADQVLCEAIGPVARALLGGGHIDQWFFSRSHDHLRVRLHGAAGPTLLAVERATAPLAAGGIVHRLVVETYEREIERHGGARAIELVERVLWRDSEAALAIVEQLDGSAGASARWQLAARGMAALLDALVPDAEHRARALASRRDALARELQASAELRGRIGERFAEQRRALERLFAPGTDHELQPGFDALARRDAAAADDIAELRRRDAAGELAPSLPGFAWSLLHAHVNRLAHTAQRAQELVLLDFLYRLSDGDPRPGSE